MHGAFTPIAHDRTKTAVDGPAYISFPGNAPPHALKCGAEGPCIFYLRYAWLFDIKYPSEGSKGECCARRRETRMSNRAPSLDGLRRHFPASASPPVAGSVAAQYGAMDEVNLRYTDVRERRCPCDHDLSAFFPILRHQSLNSCELGRPSPRGGLSTIRSFAMAPAARRGQRS
jgi:hypothetical protein